MIQPSGPSKEPIARLPSERIPADQLGLRVAWESPNTPKVNIIAVHGLGAWPRWSWKASGAQLDWLEDPNMLPAEVPDACIYRFGYDSLWFGGDPIETSLDSIAKSLAAALRREREKSPERSIIFLSHSFGGLVVEQMLIHDFIDGGRLVDHCIGAVFLGTPHRGTNVFDMQGDLLMAIADIAKEGSMTYNPEVLQAFRTAGNRLTPTSDCFARLCHNRKLKVVCFYEQRASPLSRLVKDLPGASEKKISEAILVTEASAKIDGYPALPLSVNHFTMNKYKYSDPEDGNYAYIATEIRHILEENARQTPEDTRATSCQTIGQDIERGRTELNKGHGQMNNLDSATFCFKIAELACSSTHASNFVLMVQIYRGLIQTEIQKSMVPLGKRRTTNAPPLPPGHYIKGAKQYLIKAITYVNRFSDVNEQYWQLKFDETNILERDLQIRRSEKSVSMDALLESRKILYKNYKAVAQGIAALQDQRIVTVEIRARALLSAERVFTKIRHVEKTYGRATPGILFQEAYELLKVLSDTKPDEFKRSPSLRRLVDETIRHPPSDAISISALDSLVNLMRI